MAFAERTGGAPGRTRAEIEGTLRRYGATAFLSGWDGWDIFVSFVIRGRRVLFRVPVKSPNDEKFAATPAGKSRTLTQAQAAYEQYVRARWRALLLSIKAKLESAASGIEELDEAFMGQIVINDGRRFYEFARLQIEDIIKGGPLALPPAKADRASG